MMNDWRKDCPHEACADCIYANLLTAVSRRKEKFCFEGVIVRQHMRAELALHGVMGLLGRGLIVNVDEERELKERLI